MNQYTCKYLYTLRLVYNYDAGPDVASCNARLEQCSIPVYM